MRRLLSRARSDEGQTLIEFVAIFPVILVLILMLVEFGVVIEQRHVLQNAVREGARQGSVGLTEGAITDLVVANSGGSLDAGDVTVCYADGPSGENAGIAGSIVRVKGTYTYDFSLGSGAILSAMGIAPLSIDLKPSADGRLETTLAGVTEC